MKLKQIRDRMCTDGWSQNGKRYAKEPNPLACAECESMCLGGAELLRTIPEEKFRELLCGADCETCRQPCNLRRIALMRQIKPRVVRKREKPKCKTWEEIAMRPYWERRRENENHPA